MKRTWRSCSYAAVVFNFCWGNEGRETVAGWAIENMYSRIYGFGSLDEEKHILSGLVGLEGCFMPESGLDALSMLEGECWTL